MRDLIGLVPVLKNAYGRWLSFAYLVLLTLLVFRLPMVLVFLVGLR
jgi:hypothetical protein